MRIGSRRNVCAIVLPGETGAPKPSPIGFLDSRRRGALAPDAWPCSPRPIAFARFASPAMRSRWRTISHQRLPDGLPTGERGERPLHEVVFCVAAWYRTVPATAIDLGHAPARLHGLVGVAVLHEPLAHDAVGVTERGVDVAVLALVALQHVAARRRARSPAATDRASAR